MNSKKEYVCILGVFIFVVITSFKLGSDYGVIGLKEPTALAYKNGILYVANKGNYVSMLDKYGNILELEYLNIKKPSSIILDGNDFVVSSNNELFFYQKPLELKKVIRFDDKIVQIAKSNSGVLVLLSNGDILKVNYLEAKFLCNIPNASSITFGDGYFFVVVGNFINVYDNDNCNRLETSREFGVEINYISYNDGVVSATSTSDNIVFLLNQHLDKIKSYKFDKPTFAYYSKQKFFVCSRKLGKIYIKNN
ncbi:hypothetical protein DESAMIL20_1778 [Desulfurella amilsii]|uniref:Uncharacterized protein n=1 Tax=Desulfurella amilsii TaxID=1562698 RepID=A0A1X4XXH8_9BACT|nr:hypothetical protein [Desulfurella amilsii]OSS42225.1 hypothetical protein DESAMIL20_1778 [Desulfurella amilsii]